MILPVLTALVLVLGMVAAAVDMAGGALRQGRARFRQAIAGAAAERGLAESEVGGWGPAGSALPVGGRLGLPSITDRPGVVISCDARRLTGELWLVRSRSEVRGAAGQVLAAEERGLVVRLVQDPADSSSRVIPIRRPWNRRAT